MYKCVRKFNTEGVIISRLKLERSYKKVLKTIHRCSMYLYDHGYLYDVDGFGVDSKQEKDFLSIFSDYYPDVFGLMCSKRTGTVVFNSLMLGYVIRSVGEDDKELSELLGVVHELLKARELYDSILMIYSGFKVPKKNLSFNVKMNLSITSSIKSTRKFPIDNIEIAGVLDLPYGFTYHVERLNEVRLVYVLNMLGVSDIDKSNSYLLGNGFSYDDDIDFLTLLINGDIMGGTELGWRLYDTVENYYEDFYSNNIGAVTCIDYVNKIFSETIDKCSEFLNAYRSSHGAGVELFITNDYVAFMRSGMEDVEVRSNEFEIAGFNLLYDTEKVLSYKAMLMGYGGTFCEESDNLTPISTKLCFSGIECYNCDGVLYNGSTLKSSPVVPADLEMSQKHVLEVVGFDSIEEIPEKVCQLYLDRDKKETNYLYFRLIGVLVQALTCVLCGYVLEGYNSPRHVILDADLMTLDDELFERACGEVESLFMDLEF